ncbi:uncharacterized protein [Medicago truncatula]|uniref:uncharacterized protein n=1 Tax=Medicago truncatula TaxID=3880 RepID=UPI000D2F3691|nr:uncharacterized protein LOC112418631 [Medicago truncatula]
MVGRSKKATFSFIKDRVWQKISSWSSKCLSKAGREVMIKYVLQAIPSYVMSIFRLSNTLLDEIEMMNSFWWGHGGSSNRGLNWLSWEKLSVHKNDGGMGFKDFVAFNVAMLGKQGWQLQTKPDSLVSKIFKARYYPNSNFLDAKLGHNPSFVWRSILSAKVVVRQGARWKIGAGFDIPIISEPWIGSGSSIPPVGDDMLALQPYSTANLWHLIASSIHQFDNAPDIIFNLLQSLSAAQNENIVTIMWSIWKARNMKLWQQVSDSTFTILKRAKHLLEGWRSANRKKSLLRHDNSVSTLNAPQQNGDTNVRWRKLSIGRYKCNVDASFPNNSNKAGFGMCIRDSDGNHVRSKTMFFSPVCSIDVGEAMGLHHAIRWIQELQLTNVDFEVDSNRVADYFNKGRGDATEFGSIMDSSIYFSNTYLTNSHVEFIMRQANEVAHTLARVATSNTSLHVFDDIPACITDLIFNKMI